MRFLAITGPRSGLFPLSHAQRVAQDFEPDFETLASPTDAEMRTALASHPDGVVLFGGDGTLQRHLEALIATQTPVLMVPAGSGNDFARACGTYPREVAFDALVSFAADEAFAPPADIGELRFADGSRKLFSCCANIGLDADAARRASMLPGMLKAAGGYFLAGMLSLAFYKPSRISVQAKEKRLSEQAWFVSISNTPTFGGGLKIAPQARMDDGRLDVTYARAIPRFTLARHYPKILRGKHTGLKALEIFNTEEVRVVTDEPSPVYCDGEFAGKTPVTISVLPKALRAVRYSDGEEQDDA